MREVHAPFQLAEILHARHDFLAGVATLLETHAAGKVEIYHLCDELFLRLRQDDRDAGTNVQPIPAYAADGLRVLAERLPQGLRLGCAGVDLEARVADPDDAGLRGTDEAERQLRQVANLPGQNRAEDHTSELHSQLQ